MQCPVLDTLRHSGQLYLPGATALGSAFTRHQLAHLQRRGVLGEASAEEDAGDRHAQLVAAIDELEAGNAAHWTKGGKPECDALATLAGLESVSAKERDAAWAGHQASA